MIVLTAPASPKHGFLDVLYVSFCYIGLGIYCAAFSGISPLLISTFFCLFFIGINLRGISLVGKTQTLLTLILIGLLLGVSARGLISVSLDKFMPFAPQRNIS